MTHEPPGLHGTRRCCYRYPTMAMALTNLRMLDARAGAERWSLAPARDTTLLSRASTVGNLHLRVWVGKDRKRVDCVLTRQVRPVFCLVGTVGLPLCNRRVRRRVGRSQACCR